MSTTAMPTATHVDLWFDPGCPFTWQTSRWLLDVVRQRAVDVTWRLMSLPILNEDKDIPENHRSYMAGIVRTSRVLAAAEATGGQQALLALYSAIGSRRYDEGGHDGLSDELVREAVIASGLHESLADAADDESYDAVIRASHEESQARAGTEVGSPVIAIDGGKAFFGPVVAPAPMGDDALLVFDGIRLLSMVPAFSELKGLRADV